MTLRRLARVLAILCLAAILASPAHAKDPLKRARAGRWTSIAALGGVGAGLTLVGVGGGLTTYSYTGPWWNKGRYDELFLERRPIGEGLMWSSIAVGAPSVLALSAGVLVESYGLRKVRRVSVAPGWLGVSLLTAGAALMWVPPAGATIMATGLALLVVQFHVNLEASKRLDDEIHERLYGRPSRKVALSAAPLFLEKGAGLALVGVF